ncbi:MAG: hypothetical protein WA977_02440 [Halobacteriota archaeon]
MTEKAMYNRTAKYVIDQLDDLITEIKASQSALLASGFLAFDGARFASICESIKTTVTTEKPVDFPEVHPHPVNDVGGI